MRAKEFIYEQGTGLTGWRMQPMQPGEKFDLKSAERAQDQALQQKRIQDLERAVKAEREHPVIARNFPGLAGGGISDLAIAGGIEAGRYGYEKLKSYLDKKAGIEPAAELPQPTGSEKALAIARGKPVQTAEPSAFGDPGLVRCMDGSTAQTWDQCPNPSK